MYETAKTPIGEKKESVMSDVVYRLHNQIDRLEKSGYAIREHIDRLGYAPGPEAKTANGAPPASDDPTLIGQLRKCIERLDQINEGYNKALHSLEVLV